MHFAHIPALALATLAASGVSGRADARADCPRAVSTVEIEDCQQALLATANRRLNATYARAMRALPPARRTALRRAERAWIDERDAACRIGPDQGSSGPVVAGECLIRRTDARTAHLEATRAGVGQAR